MATEPKVETETQTKARKPMVRYEYSGIPLAHRMRVYPTPGQKAHLDKAMGVSRRLYNALVVEFAALDKLYKEADAITVFRRIQADDDRLKAVSQNSVQLVIRDQFKPALDKFFDTQKRLKGSGKNIRVRSKHSDRRKFVGYPRPKRWGECNITYLIPNTAKIGSDVGQRSSRWIKIQKLDTPIKLSQKLRWQGTPRRATFSVGSDGHYYVSILVDATNAPPKTDSKSAVGVDLGIKTLATCSDGVEFAKVDVAALENRKRHVQRKLSHKLEIAKAAPKVDGRRPRMSKRARILQKRAAKIDARIARIRSAASHAVSSYLTKNHGLVGVEGLNVRGMVKNRRLAKAISGANFGAIRMQVEYKAKLRGVDVVIADRFFPSSKTCSRCGHLKESLRLSDRTYRCPQCELVIDRDLNAAINLKNNAVSSFGRNGEARHEPSDIKARGAAVDAELYCSGSVGRPSEAEQSARTAVDGDIDSLTSGALSVPDPITDGEVS
jgi:putative transposase